ncbi:nucleotidyltransferase domain-containing protein [Candidatus Woesearchaeota archaeon]|nr:nucleotidyltransferase domain-containing protein [Candidatus Woesearchaeota archaeon]
MIQKYSKYRVLQQFFDSPRKAFLIRELSRNMKLSVPSVRLHIKALLAEGLLIKDKTGLYPSFRAAKESPLFKLLKAQNMVLRLYQTGVLSTIEKATYPSCIVLFGSASRGEDTEESDIDLFVQAKRIKLDLNKFEKTLIRKINLLFEPDLTTISPELLNNLANGTVVYGYLKVV